MSWEPVALQVVLGSWLGREAVKRKYRSKDKFKDAWGGSRQMKCIGQVLKFGKKIQAFISQIMTRQIQIESEEFFVAAPLISRL